MERVSPERVGAAAGKVPGITYLLPGLPAPVDAQLEGGTGGRGDRGADQGAGRRGGGDGRGRDLPGAGGVGGDTRTGGDRRGGDELVDHPVDRPHRDLRTGRGVVRGDTGDDRGDRGGRGDSAGAGPDQHVAADDRGRGGRGERHRAAGVDGTVVTHWSHHP